MKFDRVKGLIDTQEKFKVRKLLAPGGAIALVSFIYWYLANGDDSL